MCFIVYHWQLCGSSRELVILLTGPFLYQVLLFWNQGHFFLLFVPLYSRGLASLKSSLPPSLPRCGGQVFILTPKEIHQKCLISYSNPIEVCFTLKNSKGFQRITPKELHYFSPIPPEQTAENLASSLTTIF